MVNRPPKDWGPGTTTVKKRVHCKPLQLVVWARFEGSLGLHEMPADFEEGGIRVCVDCFRGKRLAEVIAVLLDRLLETPA